MSNINIGREEIIWYLRRLTSAKRIELKFFVDELFAELSNIILSGYDLKISNFGNFKVKRKKARPGRNPRTMKDEIISERFVVTFKTGVKLKSLLNENKGE